VIVKLVAELLSLKWRVLLSWVRQNINILMKFYCCMFYGNTKIFPLC